MVDDDDFAATIEKWYEQVVKAVTLTVDDKAKITSAGAKVYADILKQNTPRSDFDYSKKGRSAGHANAKHHNKHRKTKHLADSITYKDGYTADRLHTGDTDVGYEAHYYDFLARIINDGQQDMSPKEIANLHFFDRSQEQARVAVSKAMQEAYKQVMGGGHA